MKNRFIILSLAIMCTLLLISMPNAYATDSMTKTVISSGSLQEGVTYEKFSSVLSHERSVKNEIISYVKKDASAQNVRAVVWGTREIKGLDGVYKFKLLPNVITTLTILAIYEYDGITYTETVLNKRILPNGFSYTCSERPIDKTELYYLISNSYAIDQSQYEYDKVKPFSDAFVEALSVSENSNANLEEINQAIEKLKTAYDKLVNYVELVDKTALSEKILEGKAINKIEYTTETCQVLLSAISNAEKAMNDENATQDEVDLAFNMLKDAIENMEKIKGEETVASCFGFNVIELVFTIVPMLLAVIVIRKGIIK